MYRKTSKEIERARDWRKEESIKTQKEKEELETIQKMHRKSERK